MPARNRNNNPNNPDLFRNLLLGGVVVGGLTLLAFRMREPRPEAPEYHFSWAPILPTHIDTGQSHAIVEAVQESLLFLGYDLAVDGWWGPETEGVVEQFQTDQGLLPDGIVGGDTYTALHLELQKFGGAFTRGHAPFEDQWITPTDHVDPVGLGLEPEPIEENNAENENTMAI